MVVGEKLTPTGTLIPTDRHRTCASSASLRTQSVSRPINPVFSARGTKRVGGTLPWTGLVQRRSASTDANRAVAVRDLRLVGEGEFTAVNREPKSAKSPRSEAVMAPKSPFQNDSA